MLLPLILTVKAVVRGRVNGAAFARASCHWPAGKDARVSPARDVDGQPPKLNRYVFGGRGARGGIRSAIDCANCLWPYKGARTPSTTCKATVRSC
jgi:hypothetical protein